MPEDNNAPSEEPVASPPKPKVRRISNKAPRKDSAKAPEKETETKETTTPLVDVDNAGEPATGGKPDQKRGNRRRRGKGKPSGQGTEQPREAESPEDSESDAPSVAGSAPDSVGKDRPEPTGKPQHIQRPPQPPRRKLDPDKVAKNAWKIYLAEVSEEGVALIADNDARELARRCFRLSEIFLEEEDRRN